MKLYAVEAPKEPLEILFATHHLSYLIIALRGREDKAITLATADGSSETTNQIAAAIRPIHSLRTVKNYCLIIIDIS